MSDTRKKVLVSAYATSPYHGSEPGVGWGFIAALAERCDLHVIAEEHEFRDDIQRYLVEHPEFSTRVKFVFVPHDSIGWLRKVWPPSYYWSYRRWHKQALIVAQRLHQEIGFDIVHQLNMVGFREPGYLWKLGIPFVWGPIGGMGVFPWRFLSAVGLYGAVYYLAYNIVNSIQLRFSRRPKRAAKAAGTGLIVATRENQVGAERFWNCSSTLICEVGLPSVNAGPPLERGPSEGLRIVWTGELVPRKALNLALLALANLPKHANWELHVLGDGPWANAWRKLSRELEISNRCRFHGSLPHDDALSVMASSHLMLITSLRDLTSTVTIEALALGLPTVCLDHCGFAEVVDDSCGIKVPVTRPELVIAGLASAIHLLAENEALRQRLSAGAIVRARDFSWDTKAKALDRIYSRKLSSTS